MVSVDSCLGLPSNELSRYSFRSFFEFTVEDIFLLPNFAVARCNSAMKEPFMRKRCEKLYFFLSPVQLRLRDNEIRNELEYEGLFPEIRDRCLCDTRE